MLGQALLALGRNRAQPDDPRSRPPPISDLLRGGKGGNEVREFPFVCTACDFSAPSATELAEHLRATHEPIPVEDVTEFVRRGMAASRVLENAAAALDGIPILELAETEGTGARLERLRTAAAAAIADERRPRLVELRAELEGVHVAAAEERDRQARIAKVALESAASIASVLELLQEPRP